MAASLTREQAIKRARLICKVMLFYQKIRKLMAIFREPSYRKEIFIDTEAGKVRTLWYGPQNSEEAPLFIALHGGGFIMGNPEMDDIINTALAKHVGCKIVSIDYAKAPDHPFPVAIRQIDTAICQICENAASYAVDIERMAIGGHSAGGNLSTVLCMVAKKQQNFRFVCQVLDYPPLDLATSPFEKPQPKGCIPQKMAAMFNECYIDQTQAKHPYVSPVFAGREDLTGLPPALIILAGRDSLHDEGLKYCHQLQDAGVETELFDYPNAAHGFTLNSSPDADDAISKMAEFLIKHFN